jgi:hypothetical protein
MFISTTPAIANESLTSGCFRSTAPLISYDLFLNMFLTMMFVWPLRRSSVISSRLRKVATRTL